MGNLAKRANGSLMVRQLAALGGTINSNDTIAETAGEPAVESNTLPDKGSVSPQDKSTNQPALPKVEIPFEDHSSESHHLVLEKIGEDYDVTVHSNTYLLYHYLKSIPNNSNTPMWTAYKELQNSLKLQKGFQESGQEQKYAEIGFQISGDMRSLASAIEKHCDFVLFKSSANFIGGSYGGTLMEATLTVHPGNLNGSMPFEMKDEVKFLNAKKKTRDEKYFHRAHLLANMLNGPGVKKNLMITPGDFNIKVMRDDVEAKVATEVLSKGNTVHYRVQPYYDREIRYGYEEEKYIPSEVQFYAATLKNVQTDNSGFIVNYEADNELVNKLVKVDDAEIIPLRKTKTREEEDRTFFDNAQGYLRTAGLMKDVLDTMLSNGEEFDHSYYIEQYVVSEKAIDKHTRDLAYKYLGFTWPGELREEVKPDDEMIVEDGPAEKIEEDLEELNSNIEAMKSKLTLLENE